MTLRNHCTAAQRLAHAILDRVRAGEAVDPVLVNRALAELGEPV